MKRIIIGARLRANEFCWQVVWVREQVPVEEEVGDLGGSGSK